MTDAQGRHRPARGSRGLLLVVALVLLIGGFLAGLLTGYLADSQASGGASASPSDTATASDTARPTLSTPSAAVTSAPAVAASPSTTSAAPPDPGPEAGDENAFFESLQRSGVPVEDHEEVLLALGSGICHTPPESRTDPAATAQHIVAVLADIWTPEQALRIVEAIDATLC